jgi:hypothetical protein
MPRGGRAPIKKNLIEDLLTEETEINPSVGKRRVEESLPEDFIYLDNEDREEIMVQLEAMDYKQDENLEEVNNNEYAYISNMTDILFQARENNYNEVDVLEGGSLNKKDLEIIGIAETHTTDPDILSEITTINKQALEQFYSEMKQKYETVSTGLFPNRCILYYLLQRINDNTDEGYKQRVIFYKSINEHTYSGYNQTWYNPHSLEIGFINEIGFSKFIKKKSLRPALSKYFTGEIVSGSSNLEDPLLAGVDFIFDDYAIELKGTQAQEGKTKKDGCKYDKPQYYCSMKKVTDLTNTNQPKKLIVWVEYCSDTILLNDRSNAVVKYKYYDIYNFANDKKNKDIVSTPYDLDFTKVVKPFTGLP